MFCVECSTLWMRDKMDEVRDRDRIEALGNVVLVKVDG